MDITQRIRCLEVVAVLIISACGNNGPMPDGNIQNVSASGFALEPTVPQTGSDYALFETLQVRPLALSDDGRFLFAVNTPDNRLEIFRIANNGRKPLRPVAAVAVGLEPVPRLTLYP